MPAKLQYGHARLSAAQVGAGGFDNLSLFGNVRAEGDVELRLGQSLRFQGLQQDGLGMLQGGSAGGLLALSAPYVRLAQSSWLRLPGDTLVGTAAVAVDTGRQHRFSVDADLIDLRNTTWLAGFDDVQLRSRGDLRFLGSGAALGSTGAQLIAPRSLDVTAAQLYPVADAGGVLAAGVSQPGSAISRWDDAEGIVRIHGLGGAVPVLPLSVSGGLSVVAATIEQGGILRAPLGAITLGGTDADGRRAGSVTLLPGSVTSTSGAGLSVPFGGTVDGVDWRRDGSAHAIPPVGGVAPGADPKGIAIISSRTEVAEGALLDLSGGGELTGAAFVSGRGGSVDILRHALADANPRYGFSESASPVYAILPGYTGSAAPLGLSDGSLDPGIGQQITIPAGVLDCRPAPTRCCRPASRCSRARSGWSWGAPARSASVHRWPPAPAPGWSADTRGRRWVACVRPC
ncbi:hypothetical protein NMB32_18690 [Stenotrophomonas sp. CD2]|nr:hypothetical protein NMB32_18690 [Stenotrophomonas sp. CD2]